MQMCREEVSRKGKNKHKVPSGGPWWTVRETGSSGAMEGEDKQRGGPEVRGRSSAPRGDCRGGCRQTRDRMPPAAEVGTERSG